MLFFFNVDSNDWLARHMICPLSASSRASVFVCCLSHSFQLTLASSHDKDSATLNSLSAVSRVFFFVTLMFDIVHCIRSSNVLSASVKDLKLWYPSHEVILLFGSNFPVGNVDASSFKVNSTFFDSSSLHVSGTSLNGGLSLGTLSSISWNSMPLNTGFVCCYCYRYLA